MIEKLCKKLREVRLVVTDVDGVHTDDKVVIFKVPEADRAAFGLAKAGGVLRAIVCDAAGQPGDQLLTLCTGVDERIEGYTFYTPDGIAVKECLRHDIPVVLVSGRKSPAVRQRAEDLGALCLQGITDKVAAIEDLLFDRKLGWEHILFIGNDIQDISLLEHAGFSAVPADAALETHTHADYVSGRRGGDGVVREVLQMVLEAQGHWQHIVSRARTLG